MFELVQQRIAQSGLQLAKIEELDQQLGARPELFDSDDMRVLGERHAALTAARQRVQAAYNEAAAWYKTRITDLKQLVQARAEVLEQLDNDGGLLSADAAIMEWMSQKQAHYNRDIQTIEEDLTRSIRERLLPFCDALQ